jgi:hypothetical protein
VARASPALATREQTITHADLQRLLPPSSARNRNAIILIETVKMLARGRRVQSVYNATLSEKLGWSERTIKRAKAAARDAGVVMHDEVDRRGSRATAFVLDRTWVPALGRPTNESPRGDSVGTLSKESKPLRVLGAVERCSQDPEGQPRGSPTKPEGVVEPSAENAHEGRQPVDRPAMLDNVPGAREAFDELRRRASGRAIDRHQLEAMRKQLVEEGVEHPAATVALAVLCSQLEREGMLLVPTVAPVVEGTREVA